jgi:hypothetical protein
MSSNDYKRANYDRLALLLPRGAKRVIEGRAQQEGKTVNKYVCDLLLWDSGLTAWTEAPEEKRPRQEQEQYN